MGGKLPQRANVSCIIQSEKHNISIAFKIAQIKIAQIVLKGEIVFKYTILFLSGCFFFHVKLKFLTCIILRSSI